MHHKVITVEYAREGSNTDHHHQIPRGLEKHDVYLIENKPKPVIKNTDERAPESIDHMINVI